jgi:hypothetical protein
VAWRGITSAWKELSDARVGGAVLRQRPRNEIVDRKHLGYPGRGMPRAPDIAPARRAFLPRADIDILGDVDRAALRQVIGVEAGGGEWKGAACWSADR